MTTDELPEGWAGVQLGAGGIALADLWELPEGWTWCQFQAVAKIASNLVDPKNFAEYPHIAPNHIESGTGKLLPFATIAEDKVTSPKHRFYPGHILYSKIRPYLCKAVRIDFEGLCSADMYPIETSIEPAFLLRWMLSATFTEMASNHDTRTLLPKINQEALARLMVPLPPLAEQRRIVAAVEGILAKVSSARERLGRVPATMKRFRQAVLAAACAGRLTADWRDNTPHAATQVAEESGPYELPEGWAWHRFGNLVHTIRSGSTVPPKNEETDFPILRSSSVRQGIIDLEDVKFLNPESSKNTDNFLVDGDILFTRLSGSLEYVGNCARVPPIGGKRIQYPDRLFCAKLKQLDQADYLVLAFATPAVRAMLTEGAKSSAGHQRISIGNLTSQLVPIPPDNEQLEIVRRVSALFARADAFEQRAASALKRVEALTQAVLAKAFRGELVPTEAELARREGRGYEPASELLAKLRSADTAAAPGKRAKRKA